MIIGKRWANGIALVGAFSAAFWGVCPAALAQAGKTLTVPQPAKLETMVPLAPTSAQPARTDPARLALASLLDKLEWDAATQGPLLIVSAEETVAPDPPLLRNATGDLVSAPRPTPPEVEADGRYALKGVGDFFQRKVMAVHSLSVLAPSMIAKLNDRHLPEPNPFAGMSHHQKARLLESSFTTEQWERAGSEAGIGTDDLTTEQRALYLSLLPDPFTIRPMTSSAGENGIARNSPGKAITLTGEQREGIRLRLQKQASWSVLGGGVRSLYRENSISAMPPGTPPTYRLETTDEAMGQGFTNGAFGTTLIEQVPNHAKASQLPKSIPSAEALLSLETDTTLGALVHAIAQKTGLELYADPRYASRKLYFQGPSGQSAQAGDLLLALALAVTGTWRHVGPAYILTDDIEGLGVRHARISDWLSQNTLLAHLRDTEAEGKIDAIPLSQLTHWSDTDLLRPDNALGEKLDAYEKQPAASKPANEPWSGLFVPVNELSPTLREVVTEQLKREQIQAEDRAAQNPSYPVPPVRTDGVEMNVRTNTVYVVPGIASVAADDIKGGSSAALRRKMPPPNIPPANANPAFPFPSSSPIHALLMAPHTEEEVEQIVPMAAQHGFNQLWIQTPRDDTHLLESAIRLGTPRGLKVQAVVRPLQAAATDTPEMRDRDLLGYTTSEYVQHKQAEIQQLDYGVGLPYPEEDALSFSHNDSDASAWQVPRAVDRLTAMGDYVRSDDARVSECIASDLTKIAHLPGLGGIALFDTVVPGYEAKPRPFSFGGPQSLTISDALLNLGYTDAMRLACLRKYGFDPIDLSPLQRGDEIMLPGAGMGGFQILWLWLPFFRDYGRTNHSNSSGGSGSSNVFSHWNDFRATMGQTLFKSIVSTVQTAAPATPLLSRAEGEFGNDVWFGSIDKTPEGESASLTPAVPLAAHLANPLFDNPPPGQRTISPLHDARAQSHTVFRTFRVTPAADDSPAGFDAQVGEVRLGLLGGYDWDGVVADLSELPMAQAVRIVQTFSGKAGDITEFLPSLRGKRPDSGKVNTGTAK